MLPISNRWFWGHTGEDAVSLEMLSDCLDSSIPPFFAGAQNLSEKWKISISCWGFHAEPLAYPLHLQTVGPALLFQGGGDTVLQSYYKDRMSHISALDVLTWGAAISVTFNWLILGVRLELTLVGPHTWKHTHTPLSLNKRLHSPGRVPTLLSVFTSLPFWIWNYRLVNKTLDRGG